MRTQILGEEPQEGRNIIVLRFRNFERLKNAVFVRLKELLKLNLYRLRSIR